MTFFFILFIHCVLCVALIGLVLVQQGKGADAGATFGGGGGNTVFGAAGATDFITKLTTALAIGFMVTSIFLVRSYQSNEDFSFRLPFTGGEAPVVEMEPESPASEGAGSESAAQESVVPEEGVVPEEAVEGEAGELALPEGNAEEGTSADREQVQQENNGVQ